MSLFSSKSVSVVSWLLRITIEIKYHPKYTFLHIHISKPRGTCCKIYVSPIKTPENSCTFFNKSKKIIVFLSNYRVPCHMLFGNQYKSFPMMSSSYYNSLRSFCKSLIVLLFLYIFSLPMVYFFSYHSLPSTSTTLVNR